MSSFDINALKSFSLRSTSKPECSMLHSVQENVYFNRQSISNDTNFEYLSTTTNVVYVITNYNKW